VKRRPSILAAAVLAVVSLAACGTSPEDEARNEGEQIGADVRDLFDVASAEEARTVLENLQADVQDVSEETRERVSEQVDTQRATLAAGIEGLAAGDTSSLKSAAQQVRAQADAFRNGNDSIANEFWRGFEEGYDDE
jgi:hypothetical protein